MMKSFISGLLLLPFLIFADDSLLFRADFDGFSVALAFSVQELPEVECDPWDKKPDRILTEKGRI